MGTSGAFSPNKDSMNLSKEIVSTLQVVEGVFYTAGSIMLYIGTFVSNVLEDDGLIIKIPVAFFIICGGLYYLARFRKLWVEASNARRTGKTNTGNHE